MSEAKASKTLSKLPVTVTSDISDTAGVFVLKGTQGVCVWDEGGSEVIVEFQHEVRNQGLLTNRKQAWILRAFLAVSGTKHAPRSGA